jgi:putative PIN family toxin of toxin-antitoxin system
VKVVPDTMLWVSYCTLAGGFRQKLIDRARRNRARLFVSDYILKELTDTLIEDLGRSRRFAWLARRAVLRAARLVKLTAHVIRHVETDPADDAIVQTALTAKADYLVTADKELLRLKNVLNTEIITANRFAEILDAASES